MALLSGNRECYGIIAGLLVLAVLAGAAPLTSEFTIRTDRGAPALTLDICHPLPGLNHGTGFSPTPFAVVVVLVGPGLIGLNFDSAFFRVIQQSESPDPPPPKRV